MFGKQFSGSYFFATRPFWCEMRVPNALVLQKYKEYFGDQQRTIAESTDAVKYLSEIISRLQAKFVKRLQTDNPKNTIKDLYKILDEVWRFYYSQKEVRSKLRQLKTNSTIVNTFVINRNMARNVIDSVNLWLENAILYQDKLLAQYDSTSFEVNHELFVELFIYGSVSKALSLINMSKKFEDKKLFYGVSVDINKEEPLEILRYHPIIYFSDLLVGNQDAMPITKYDLKHADESEFGKAFHAEYGLSFLYAMRIFSTLESEMLNRGKYAFIVITKDNLIDKIEYYSAGVVDGNKFFDCFALTREKIKKHIRKNDPIIWVMGSNKYRHEIRPLICLDDKSIAPYRLFLAFTLR